jgi:hypothetical protein
MVMKIIITESQYRLLENYNQEDDVTKKLLFNIWQNELDSNGEIDFDTKIANYINYKPIGRVHEFYRDFLGGWDNMVEKSYELMDRTFDTMDYDFRGGYDFRFKIHVKHYFQNQFRLEDVPDPDSNPRQINHRLYYHPAR